MILSDEPSYFQAFNFEEELPEYDMDSEDEDWLKNFNKKKVRSVDHAPFPWLISLPLQGHNPTGKFSKTRFQIVLWLKNVGLFFIRSS